MGNETTKVRFQLHIDMYPLSGHEQKVCDDLFAHIAALNAINESEFALKFTLLEEVISFIEKLLQKNNVRNSDEKSFVAKVIHNHLHICRNESPYSQFNDLAIISYLNQ
jgi:hypothetical protein